MGEDDLPETVRALLTECIESYEELEILLLLHGVGETGLTAVESALRLRIGSPLAAAALGSLTNRGLVSTVGSDPESKYVYSPNSPILDEAVGCLAREYRNQPIRVIKLLSRNAIERLRAGALRAFADAFILGKGSRGG
ncbi:MAG: hypothetical protein ACRD3E_11655 [Terriglobales bacterium]